MSISAFALIGIDAIAFAYEIIKANNKLSNNVF